MAISNSDIPQPLWERAVALVQDQGLPVNASTIQSAMNMLAEGGSGAAEVNIGANIDELMDRTDGKAPVAPVDRVALSGVNGHLDKGMDEHALGNLMAEASPSASPKLPSNAVNGMLPPTRAGAMKSAAQIGRSGVSANPDPDHIGYQGPASLNSHDAEAPDARGTPISPEDTANAAPGTQDFSTMGTMFDDASSAIKDLMKTLIVRLNAAQAAPSATVAIPPAGGIDYRSLSGDEMRRVAYDDTYSADPGMREDAKNESRRRMRRRTEIDVGSRKQARKRRDE